MTYYGIILLMTGYQADEEHIVRQYKGIVNKYVISLVLKLLSFQRVLESRRGTQTALYGC